MKKFSIAKQPQEILGHKFPANTVYGHVMLKYTIKIPTGKTYRVTDKHGHLVFDKDGSPMIRYCTRAENRTQKVYYAVQDFQPCAFKDGAYFRAWIKTTMDGYWHETVLCRNAWLKQLNTFIAQKMRDNGINLATAWFNTDVRVHTNKAHETAQSAAHRRETPRTFIFEGGEGQLLRARHGINEEVRFNPDGASIKGVIASHKDGFGTKAVYDPAKASAEDARMPKFGYTAEGVRVVFPKKSMAHDTAITHGNGHYVAGNGAELERTQNAGKDLHEVASAEYWDKPRKAPKPELKGKEPTFRKVVETPTGIRRFYNEQEYNDYVSAQAVIDGHKPAPKKGKKKIIIVTQAR